QPAGIEPASHVTVEETDIMLQFAASQRGVCLLPKWLLSEKNLKLPLESLRFKDLPLTKTLYLATRHEDSRLEYIQWLVEYAKS
ncbi:MAG: LysR substrate-binding domain-containing protein, partial [Gammaproteobacteria bacterium]